MSTASRSAPTDNGLRVAAASAVQWGQSGSSCSVISCSRAVKRFDCGASRTGPCSRCSPIMMTTCSRSLSARTQSGWPRPAKTRPSRCGDSRATTRALDPRFRLVIGTLETVLFEDVVEGFVGYFRRWRLGGGMIHLDVLIVRFCIGYAAFLGHLHLHQRQQPATAASGEMP